MRKITNELNFRITIWNSSAVSGQRKAEEGATSIFSRVAFRWVGFNVELRYCLLDNSLKSDCFSLNDFAKLTNVFLLYTHLFEKL